MRRAAAAATLVGGLLAACVGQPPASTAPAASHSVGASVPPGPSTEPSESHGTATPISVEPGRPFDAETILAAMRSSRRPGGVPDQLETPGIAAAVADSIWTVDGQPWTTMSLGGTCASASACTLEVGGALDDAVAEDVWVFAVDPAAGTLDVESATLRSLPADLVTELDVLATDAVPLIEELGLVSTAVRWRPPPDDGQFELSYRSGDETGCALELLVDAAGGTVVETSRDGC